MSAEAEAIDAALEAYRKHEHTERRDEAYANLRDVVEAVKQRTRPDEAGKDSR